MPLQCNSLQIRNIRAVWIVLRGMRQIRISKVLTAAGLSVAVGASLLTGLYRGQERVTAEPVKAVATVVEPLAAPTWDLANIDHPRVDYWIERFTTDKRDEFATYLARSGRYEGLIRARLAERGMPQDLLYLAMIESGFNPKAYSHAHASGIWQFISDTGRRYGLDINRAVDERNDPVKATDAALDYLSDLHERFGSWYLAAASYNTGENRVGRIMRQVTGSEKGTDADYYMIWDRLPRETRDYVPLMIAAARIAKDPVAYGFDHVELYEPVNVVEQLFDAATPLAQIALKTGTSVDVIRQLNPQLKLNRTRNDMPSVVRLPAPEKEEES
jgi:membrane-bound lytic murein transglycosylase D